MEVSVRRLTTDDIGQVVEIEREAFSPLWVATPFKRELNNRYASYLVACCADERQESQVAEANPTSSGANPWQRMVSKFQNLTTGRAEVEKSGSIVAGYVSVWYQGEEAHITEIAVREHLRGRGIGELLLIGSLRAALEYGSKVMTLEVRVSNFVAQRLYEKYGFQSVGLRKAYYADNREDAVIMTTNPIGSEDYRRMFDGLQDSFRSRWGEIAIWT